jgi:hypothetical protein
MSRTEQRHLALGAARTLIRQIGGDPVTASALLAHAVLMAYSSTYPERVVSRWYRSMTEEEIQLFYRDWDIWQTYQHWLRC